MKLTDRRVIVKSHSLSTDRRESWGGTGIEEETREWLVTPSEISSPARSSIAPLQETTVT